MPIRGPKKQEKLEKLCKQLEGFDQGRHLIIVPEIDKSHYSDLTDFYNKRKHKWATTLLNNR